jgi:hypothetical protein
MMHRDIVRRNAAALHTTVFVDNESGEMLTLKLGTEDVFRLCNRLGPTSSWLTLYTSSVKIYSGRGLSQSAIARYLSFPYTPLAVYT